MEFSERQQKSGLGGMQNLCFQWLKSLANGFRTGATYNLPVPPEERFEHYSGRFPLAQRCSSIPAFHRVQREFTSDGNLSVSIHAPSSSSAEPLEDSFVRSSGRFVLLMSMLALLCAGCQPQAEIRQYVVEPEQDRIITSDALKDEFGVIPFQWDLPDTWASAENDKFSKLAWAVGDKTEAARITLSDLPIAAGLVPQVTRWRRQLSIEPGSDDDPMKETEELKLGGGSGTYVELNGAEQSILGLMVPNGSKLWIFKFRGSTAVTETHKGAFRKFCESVNIPETQEGK